MTPATASRRPSSCRSAPPRARIVTGLLYVDSEPEDLHKHLGTSGVPLNSLGEKELCPGAEALAKTNASLR